MRDGVNGLNILAMLDGEAAPLASGDGATLPKKPATNEPPPQAAAAGATSPKKPATNEPPPQAAAAAPAAADTDSDSESAQLTAQQQADQQIREKYGDYQGLPPALQELFTKIILKNNKAEEELAALKAQKSTEAPTATEAQKHTKAQVGGRTKRKAAYIPKPGGAKKGGTALATAAAGEKRKRDLPVAEEGEETEEEDGEPARRVRRKDSECPVMQK